MARRNVRSCFLHLIAALTLFISVHASASSPPGRPEPSYANVYRFGKGSVKLYNCLDSYKSSLGYANLSHQISPARFLIKLKDSMTSAMVDHICEEAETGTEYYGHCAYRYQKVWLGMLMVITGQDLTKLVHKMAYAIDHVEVEGVARISVLQVNPPWGLDRIDRRPGEKLLNSLYNVSASGQDVHVYVLDTGIRCTHEEFWYADGRTDIKGVPISRCMDGFDGIGDGNGTSDCNGHGTHCAGIVAGLKGGVAKSSLVHPVRVMDCDGIGRFGAILAGMEWISENVIMPAVVSMSIATQASISIDQAVDNLVNTSGIFAVAASGNFLTNACNYSPSRASRVISVASSNIVNAMSWFSNYGNCTSIFAPGELILSAYKDSDTAFATLSGTSMACPHVAGAAALYLSENVDARPSEVRQSILDAAEPNAITYVKPMTTTRLLNVNMQAPPVNIHPRSIYNASEGSSYFVVVSLKVKPTYPVTLAPYFSDPNIGEFSPSKLVFKTDSTWSFPQVLKLLVTKNPDFLDHSSMIQWAFTSRDVRYVICPEGYLVSLDTDICRFTSANPCGQTRENPKIIPSLPFFYYDDSSKYVNLYDTDFDECHSSGPDVVYQYTPITDVVVNISLCGPTTQYDSMLSVYEKILSSKGVQTVKVACNDDFCMAGSALSMVPLLKGRTYIFMIDGYQGDGGPFEIYINQLTATTYT